jgi:mRNA interferase MazF
VKRAEIWIADFPPPDKRRPVVLVSREAAYETREMLTVAPITTRLRAVASHVTVGAAEGLERPSAINCDRLQTIHRSVLRSYVGPLSDSKVEDLDDALRYSLGLD